jgi:hypothetical protein
MLWEYPSNFSEIEVVQRARASLGEKWTLGNNCEHVARGSHGKRISYQLLAGLGVVLCIGLWTFFPATRPWA